MAVNKNVWFWTTALAVLLIDQFAKVIIRSFLWLNQSITVLPFFSITHTENIGVAFGLLKFEILRWIFALVSLGVIIAILFYYKKIPKNKSVIVSIALILGGAAGNLIDRILFGAVTDFINFSFWPAFNFADAALTVGVIMLLWLSLKKR